MTVNGRVQAPIIGDGRTPPIAGPATVNLHQQEIDHNTYEIEGV